MEDTKHARAFLKTDARIRATDADKPLQPIGTVLETLVAKLRLASGAEAEEIVTALYREADVAEQAQATPACSERSRPS